MAWRYYQASLLSSSRKSVAQSWVSVAMFKTLRTRRCWRWSLPVIHWQEKVRIWSGPSRRNNAKSAWWVWLTSDSPTLRVSYLCSLFNYVQRLASIQLQSYIPTIPWPPCRKVCNEKSMEDDGICLYVLTQPKAPSTVIRASKFPLLKCC